MRSAGSLTRAKTTCLRALRIFEAHDGPDHPDVANVLLDLAGIFEELGQHRVAQRHVERAITILRPLRMRGDDLRRLRLKAFMTLGGIAIARGDFPEAERAQRRALAIAQRLSPADAALAMNGLGVICKYTARWDEAARLYRAALAALKRDETPDVQLTIATLLHNLGGLEHSRGRFGRAEPHARRSVAIRESVLGKHHPSVGADVAALAAILDGRGKHDEAEALYRRALGIFRRRLGADHFEVAFNLAQLAALHQSTDRPASASRLYARALPMLERRIGRHHPMVASALTNMAALRESEGKMDLARRAYERSLAIYRSNFGDGHPDTQACAASLAALPTR